MSKVHNLGKHERLHVEGILAKYGLQGDKHMTGSLTVHKNSVVKLSRHSEDRGTHLVLKTHDLDQFKRWVGVPDAIFEDEEVTYNHPIPEEMIVNVKKCPCSMTHLEKTALYDAARCYIWGPSHRVSAYKETIEKMFAPMEVVTHIYTTLDVHSTLVFEETDQAVVVLANTINFYPGGKIEARGTNLTIQATNIYYKSN